VAYNADKYSKEESMKKQILSAALLLAGMAPIAAQAGDMDVKPYMGVGVGAFGLEYKDTAISQKQTTFGGFIKGGADIGDYFGVELRVGTATSGSKSYGAGTLGAAAGTFKTTATYFVSYLAKFQVPASAELKPYILVGGTTAKFKSTNSATTTSASKAKTGISYGAGIDYAFADQFSANVEWMQYWNNVKLGTNYATAPVGATDSKAKIWGIVAAVDYHF